MSVHLTLGDHGDAVVRLQQLLAQHGHFAHHPSGTFDDVTLEAVHAFRLANGLHPADVVDDIMWTSLGGDGLHDVEHVDHYTHDAYEAAHVPGHGHDSAEQTLARAGEWVNAQLRSIGVPELAFAVNDHHADPARPAFVDLAWWCMYVSRAELAHHDEAGLEQLASTLYAEAGYAEAAFRAAAHAAGEGRDADHIAGSMSLKHEVAVAAVAARTVPQVAGVPDDAAVQQSADYLALVGQHGDAVHQHATEDFVDGGRVEEVWHRQSPSADPYDGTLQRGAHGEHVAALERALAAIHLYHGAIEGEFGPKLESAVVDFAQRYVRADAATGIWHGEYWQILHQLLPAPTP